MKGNILFSQRWFIVAPVLLLLGWLVKSSYSMLVADIYHHHVNGYLEHWIDGYRKFGEDFHIPVDELDVVLKNANRAVSQQPDDPKQLLLLAKVLQWRPFFEPESSDLLIRQPEELDLIRKAIILRPAWPYSWITLAEAKARHSEIDQEFNQALIQAGTLGSWEREVMVKLERLGNHYQEWLSPEAKVVTDRNLKRLGKAYSRRT